MEFLTVDPEGATTCGMFSNDSSILQTALYLPTSPVLVENRDLQRQDPGDIQRKPPVGRLVSGKINLPPSPAGSPGLVCSDCTSSPSCLRYLSLVGGLCSWN